MKNPKRFIIALTFMFCAAWTFSGGAKEEPSTVPESPVASTVETSITPAAETPGAYPLTLDDDTGRTMTIPAKPQRIASLTLFTDDVLLELVSKERLIAVTSFSEDPDISNIADRVADIPHKLRMNVEIILSLQPDIVFVANWSEADKVQQLRNAGLKVFLLESGFTVEQIQQKIATVARIVGEVKKGQKLITWMDETLEKVRSKVAGILQKERLVVMDYAVWGTSPGQGSSWDEIVRLAGLKNAVGDLPVDDWGQVPVSKEKLVELDPDILILPGWVYGNPEGAKNFIEQTSSDPALQGLQAIQKNRVYQLPEGLKSSTSHYIVLAIEYLAKTAYPDLFVQ